MKNIFSYALSISNWLLLLGGVIIVSYLFFVNIKEKPPLTIDKIEIIHSVILPSEPLQLKVHATVNKLGCDMYAERTVINAETNETIWQSVSPINSKVLVKEIISDKPIKVLIPNIKPGKYFYYAKVHMICGTHVDIIPTKLLPFTVQ